MEEQERVERRASMLERWEADEESGDGKGFLEIVDSPCESCRFANPENSESCKVYSLVPWEFRTDEVECPDYQAK